MMSKSKLHLLKSTMLIFVVLFTPACVDDGYTGPYDSIEVIFSDELTPQFIRDFLSSFQEFLDDSGIDTVMVSTTQTFRTFSDITTRRHGESFTIYVSRRTEGMNYNGCYHRDGTALLPLTDFLSGTPFTPRHMANTALHELGHACGHPHVPAVSAPPGNIMADSKLNDSPLPQPLTPSYTRFWAEEQLPAIERCFYVIQ